MEKHEEVLVALRQIIRAIDLHSKKLNKDAGLTGPQLILMRSIHDLGEQVTIRELAVHTNMSQGTATTILDRLERNGYVQRVRSNSDKRKVHAHLTDEGRKLLAQAPQPLQESFVSNSINSRLGTELTALFCTTHLSHDERARYGCRADADDW